MCFVYMGRDDTRMLYGNQIHPSDLMDVLHQRTSVEVHALTVSCFGGRGGFRVVAEQCNVQEV